MPRFCQKSDLARVLGSEAVLVQLLDKDEDGIPDDALVNDVLDAGCNELASYIALSVNPDTLKEPFPYVLIFKSAQACAFHAWARGSDGQAVPQNVMDAYGEAVRWAKDVGDKKAMLVATPKPALDQPIGLVDQDPKGTSVSVAGFMKGFR